MAVERDPGVVHRGVAVGRHREQVVVGRTATVEVEVGVAGQVDHRGRVRDGGELQADLVTGHLEAGGGSQRPGVPLVPVGADQGEQRMVGVDLDQLPDPPVEPVRPPVQRVAPVVGADLVLGAVEREPPGRDAVGVAADRAAEVRRRAQVVLGAGMAEHHVASYAVAVGDLQPVHGGAEVEQLQHDPRLAAEGDRPHRSCGGVADEADAGVVEGHGASR